ncbi:MAG: M56 family metallopeptidase, partial [Alphaproteobacteria bacterium]
MAAEILKALLITNLAAALAIVLVLALRAPLRRWLGAGAAYGLWLAVPFAAAATLIPGLPRFVTLPAVQTATVTAGSALTQAAATAPQLFNWPWLALACWAAGAVGCATAVALGQRRALSLLGRMSHQAGDPPEMFRASGTDGPAIVGAVRPRIIIPADFERRFEPCEQRVIIAHETEHLIRGDVGVNAFCAAMACLNWFNPLVHVAAFAIRIDQELACDAAVVARYPSLRRTYGAALLKTQVAGMPLPLGCYWPGRSHQLIRERLQSLAQTSPSPVRQVLG